MREKMTKGEIYRQNLKLMERHEDDTEELEQHKAMITVFLKWFTVNREVLSVTKTTREPVEWS